MSTDNELELTLTPDEIAISEGREPESAGNQPPTTPPPADAAAPADDDEPDSEEVISEGEGDDAKRKRKVSYGAFYKERQERQRIERERAQEREQYAATMARGDERMRQLMQMVESAKPKQEEPAPPDPTLDPLGRMEYLEKRLEQLGQSHEQKLQQAQETQVRNQMAQFTYSDEQNARQQAPDYDAAKEHLLLSRGREIYVASGGRASEADIRKQLAVEEESLRISAIHNNVRPSVALYQMAVARGYTPKGGQPAPVVNPEANKRIEEVARAQDANRSLSTASTGASPKSYSFADIAAMPQDEFEALRNKMGPKAFDAKLERLMSA